MCSSSLLKQIPGSANSQVQGSAIFVPSEVYLDSANSQVKVNTISIIIGAEQPGNVFFILTEQIAGSANNQVQGNDPQIMALPIAKLSLLHLHPY